MAGFTTPQHAVEWLRAHGVQSLTTDSREAGPAAAFIAWPGAANDPRRYVASALDQGAAACLVEQAGVEVYAFDTELTKTLVVSSEVAAPTVAVPATLIGRRSLGERLLRCWRVLTGGQV